MIYLVNSACSPDRRPFLSLAADDYFLPADQAAPAANDVKVVSKLAKLETVVSH